MNKIYSTLQKLGLTSKRSRIKFSKKTRDKEKQNVWLDKKSGVIYIDDYYVGDNEYELGNYRDKIIKNRNVRLVNSIKIIYQL